MPSRMTPMAIAYDFDGTLAPGYMQHHSFLPELKIKPETFWPEVKKFARKHDGDEILAYMYFMLKEATNKEVPITKNAFVNHGKDLELFPGVGGWFDRLNVYAKSQNIKLEHFIISSGLREIIAGTSINKHFKNVFASAFAYDANDVALWPTLAVNYTTKTQYLFRINKGVDNSYDNDAVNRFIPEDERPIPFENMVYLGDGETDVPTMKMVKHKGGTSIAIYDSKIRSRSGKPSPKTLAKNLVSQDRADFALSADYSEGAQLDLALKAVIDKLSAISRLKKAAK